ncbi:hypothetical protein ACSBR1_012176 [Camellia fascicularis]
MLNHPRNPLKTPLQNPLPLPTRFQTLAFSHLRPSLRQSPPLKITSQPLAQTFYRNRGSNQLHLVDLQTLHKIRPREA